ncbi:MAG: cation-transporting P-type ATPase [Nitrosomonas sp.]|nr:cation-transporting P-type ATPase [Nitrosomonas sp.]
MRYAPPDRLNIPGSLQDGLDSAQIKIRQQQYGDNRIVEMPPTDWRDILRNTLRDPMLWFLLGTSALFLTVGELTEAIILLVALIPFLGMDAYLHRRTQASIASLSGCLTAQTTVIRDGQPQRIAAAELVPGDLVLLGTGESCPADGLIEYAEDVLCDESLLTGEAFPVRKLAVAALPHQEHAAHIASESWLFAGTRLLKGNVCLRIIFTGVETLYGEIVHSAMLGTHTRTPLQSAVSNLVAILLAAAAVICLGLAWVRWEQGHGLLDALLSAVTLAVAALPEEFPVVLTFFLGVGVYRLAKRQALVRRAVVVENIGRVSRICSDKTGTLTEGRLRLSHRYPAQGFSEERLLEIAAMASRHETNDPVDLAILNSLETPLHAAVVESFPFTEDRKCEAAIIRSSDALLAVLKGAPEMVLARCKLDRTALTGWQQRIDELAGSGHKVIACAWQTLDDASWHGGEPDRDFIFAGVLAFEDPVREGVPEAVRLCRDAQIRIIMITGDHPATASAVAREIGLGGAAPRVVTADEIQTQLVRGEFDVLRNIDVIARAVPAQKLLLVQTLQNSGEIVAVTGDGINDVPALQAADIGIAMGQRGTRSAREVAAIVLLDDNFHSIVQAIAEGRQLFTNLQLSFQYLLMIHLPLVLTAALIPLAGYPMLYLPIHIVWLELVIHPTALLVFQEIAGNKTLVYQPPTKQLRFFSRWQWFVMGLTGLTVTVIVTLAYIRSLGAGYDVDHARAMALVTLIAASVGITAVLSRMHSRAAWYIVSLTIGLSCLLVQIPALAGFLHLAPLHVDDWLLAVASGMIAAALTLLGRANGLRRIFRKQQTQSQQHSN